MSTADFAKIEELFTEALAQAPAERAAFLRDRIADADVRREVAALLARDERPHDVFGVDATDLAARVVAADGPAGGLPERIGPYRVLEVLGAGGMGIVYRAEQESPRRAVALKVIRPGYVTPQVLRRFAQEAQVLGRLQHPGIAQIFEAGTADLGAGHAGLQPYFAMELVAGRPLLEHADVAGLGPRERIALMARICDAVQHAHANDVVHRDLKPANILVQEAVARTDDDGATGVRDVGAPKILDFGVARAVGSVTATTTVRTDIGQLVGTLPYMSPEQIAGDPLRIDARSDVYALGVILYELLAGRLPQDVLDKPLPEAARIIRDVDPTPLSRVDRAYRGDLDTITAKALEKNSEQRYASAAALADDLRRHLSDEPIVARPATTIYQLRKFARRNRTLVAGVAAVIVVLATGLAVSTGLFLRAEDRADGMQRALYAHRVALAAKAIDTHDGLAAAQLLAACPEDLRHWEWRRQAYRADRSVLTIEAHTGQVGAVAFLPDGRLVTAGGYDYITTPEDRDSAVRIWDPRNGRMLAELTGHTDAVNTIAVSPDGARIATVSSCTLQDVPPEARIRVWDVEKQEQVQEHATSGSGAKGLAFTAEGTGVVVSGSEGRIHAFDLATGGTRWHGASHEWGIQDIAVTRDGSGFVSVGWKGDLIVSDADTGATRLELRPHGDSAIVTLAVHPEAPIVATGGHDGTARVLDWRTGEAVLPPIDHEETVTAVAFAPDGRLITGTKSGVVRVWDDAESGSCRVLDGHRARVLGIAVSPDGRWIASASGDGTAKLWRIDMPPDVLVTSPHDSEVNDVAWSPDGVLVATAGDDHAVCINDFATGKVVRRLEHEERFVYAVAWSADGARLVSGDHRGGLSLWDPHTGERLRQWQGHDGAIDHVCFASGRAQVISRGRDRRLAVSDAVTGSLRYERPSGRQWFGSVAVLAPGDGSEHVFYSGPDGGVESCDAPDGAAREVIASWSHPVSTLAVDDAGRLLAAGDQAGNVRIIDVARGRVLRTLAAHNRECKGVDFSPDGRRVVTAGLDHRVRIFDVATGDHMLTLEGQRSGLHCVAFSPDGASIAAGGQDKMLRIWRTSDPADAEGPK